MQPVVLVVTLDDGGLLYGSSDEEGNKPGVIFGRLNGQALALDITHTMPPVGWRTV